MVVFPDFRRGNDKHPLSLPDGDNCIQCHPRQVPRPHRQDESFRRVDAGLVPKLLDVGALFQGNPVDRLDLGKLQIGVFPISLCSGPPDNVSPARNWCFFFSGRSGQKHLPAQAQNCFQSTSGSRSLDPKSPNNLLRIPISFS